jgi:type VI secretion system protein ImpH
MGAGMGRETDTVALFDGLSQTPYRYDFYQALRRIECLFDSKPRWGHARRPVDEPVRLGQDPDLSFAPAPLMSFESGRDGKPARLQVRLFGLLGPNGPLPLHITEYARERLRHAGDPTLSRFLDLFNHRFLTLFYRAWAQAQPHVNRDRPKDDRFAVYIGSFFGMAPEALRDGDALPDLAKFFHVGTLVRHTRNAEGLAAILQHFCRVPVRIEEFVDHWMTLDDNARTRLSGDHSMLGSRAVLGGRVWDRQYKFRIHLGPLSLVEYQAFLPGGSQLQKVVDWVRLYLNFELDWDVNLLLKEGDVPATTLGKTGRLGWTTWLGRRRAATVADDLCLDAEAFAGRAGA